jgi:hypothetical protein
MYNAIVRRDIDHFIEHPDTHTKRNPMHKIFSFVPLDHTNSGRMIPISKFASPHIRRIVSYIAANVEAEKRIIFFQRISRQSIFASFSGNAAASTSGVLFERFVLSWLTAGSGHLDCTPAPGLSVDTVLKIPACGNERTIFWGSNTPLKDTKEHTATKEEPLCLLPEDPTLDAIVLTVDDLITIQTTVSEKHGALPSGFKLVEESGIKQKRRWRHVFVTDEDSRAKSLRSQNLKDLPKGISIYSAVFNVGRSDMSVAMIEAFEVSGFWLHAIGAH